MKYKCLSIVSPNGTRISKGEKTIEVRSWIPNLKSGEDLLIVENTKFLRNEGETDSEGQPVALVIVRNVREFVMGDVLASCATRWELGYYSWELCDIRPIKTDRKVLAARGIYEVECDLS